MNRQLRHTIAEIAGPLVAVLVLAGAIVFALLSPYFESQAFNRCTGSNASYWDAVFTHLRIDDCKR